MNFNQQLQQYFSSNNLETEELNDGSLMPIDNLASGLEQLENKVGVAVLPYAVLQVSGSDACRFLNGLSTNKLPAEANSETHLSLFCGDKGKIIFPAEVVCLAEDKFFILAQEHQPLIIAQHLHGYHIEEELQIGSLAVQRIELWGNQVTELLKRAGLEQLKSHWRGQPVLVANSSLLKHHHLVLVAQPLVMPLLDHLSEQGLELLPLGKQSLSNLYIQSKLPLWQRDYDQSFLPEEAGLKGCIAFNKGCYLGQEIHARLHYRGSPRRRLYALTADQPLSVDDSLYLAPDNQKADAVGQVTSASQTRNAGQFSAIGLLRYEKVKDVAEVQNADGNIITLSRLATDTPH